MVEKVMTLMTFGATEGISTELTWRTWEQWRTVILNRPCEAGEISNISRAVMACSDLVSYEYTAMRKTLTPGLTETS